VGVVGLVTGGILWAAATSKNDHAVSQWQAYTTSSQEQAGSTRSDLRGFNVEAGTGSSQAQARSTRSDAESLATGANVCLIAGGVLAGVGAITTLLTFVDDGPSKSVALAPAPGPSFAGLTMRGTW
jgi:hypothetical protein